ncbi:MAG: hypothetical protein WDA71_04075 [Actinomycetota bacterium]
MIHMRRLLVPFLAAAVLTAACTGGGKPKEKAAAVKTDPMYLVSDRATFISTGQKQGDWYWLNQQKQQARWDFSALPSPLTDLVTQFRVLVPKGTDVARFYVSFGTKGSGDHVLGRAVVALPVVQTNATTGESLAAFDATIPADLLPEGMKSLWVAASLEDESGTKPPIDAEVAFRKESVRFAPLRLPASSEKPVPDDTTSTTGSTGVTTETAAAERRQPHPTTSTPASPFTSDGDLISGWYWLRDSAHTQSGTWAMAAPTASGNFTLDLEVLATSRVSGPPGVDARFYLSYGPIPDTRDKASIPTTLVKLPNISPANDPVGYTCKGSITLSRSVIPHGTRQMWVRITRADASGAGTVSEHIAVNAGSVRLGMGGGGATPTTGTTGTTLPTGASPTSTTGAGADSATFSCDDGALSASAFAPIESAARWWSDDQGVRWFLLRTLPYDLTQLPESYVPINQSATWTFHALPAGAGDVRVRFTIPIAELLVQGHPITPAAYTFKLMYGAIPAPGSGRINGPDPVAVALTQATPRRLPTARPIKQALSASSWQPYAIYQGEATVPRAALNGAAGYWLRLALADPTSSDYARAQAALNQQSAQVCTGGLATTSLDATPTTPTPTVTWSSSARTLTSSTSIFTDLATDPDGDGLNQSFENAAADLVNPVLEFDEAEEWLTHRTEHPATMLVDVTPWPSYKNVKYVVFAFLTTYAYDAGFGVTWNDLALTSGGLKPIWVRLGYEEHRGDSEKVYEAYRVVDDRHLRLDWVATSAHDDGTLHNAVWSATGQLPNVGNVTVVNVNSASTSVETENWSAALEFGGPQGQLLVYPGRDKHAVYPTKAACEAVTLVRVRYTSYVASGLDAVVSYFGFGDVVPTTITVPVHETCGWDPLIDLSDFGDDSRYLGNGHWRLTIFNVGEPGNWLVDSLSDAAGWRGLTTTKIAALTGKYPGEHVWTGLNLTTDFCGGLPVQTGDHTYPSACSGRPGAKYDSPPAALAALMTNAP